jgi:hypothetical protein
MCTRLLRGKMHSVGFNGIDVFQGRWQHGEKVGSCYPSGLEKSLSKWDIYVRLVTKGLKTYYTPSLCRIIQDLPTYHNSFPPYEFYKKMVGTLLNDFHAASSTSLSWSSNFTSCINSLIWDPTNTPYLILLSLILENLLYNGLPGFFHG